MHINYMRQSRKYLLSFLMVMLLTGSFQFGVLAINQYQFTKEFYQLQYQPGFNSSSQSEYDTDGDGVTDRNEVEVFGTDPLKIDTDGDGYTDLQEIVSCYDPNDTKNRLDFDKADKWRVRSGLHPIEGKVLDYLNSNPLGSFNNCKENTPRITLPF